MIEHVDFILEKIFESWKRLEANDKAEIESELRLFVYTCKGSLKMATAMLDSYSFMYNRLGDNGEADFPIISTFLKEVQAHSKEAYNFLTEGHDIANFKEYIKLRGKDADEITRVVFGLSGYSVYMQHAFIKILNESDEKKKKVMLRGLLGI